MIRKLVLMVMVGILSLHLQIPACLSLKEKRGRLKPLIHRLHREFNLSVAEMDLQDQWQEALIVCAMVGNDHAHLERSLQVVVHWIEGNWPEGNILRDSLQFI